MKEKTDNRAITIFMGLLGIAYLFPFHTNPLASFYNDFLVIWGIVTAIAFIGREKKLSIEFPWITIIPLFLAGVIAVQMLMGMVPKNSDGIFPIIYFVFAAIAIVTGASLSADREKSFHLCIRFGQAYLLIGLISAVIASFQFFAKESLFAPFMMLMAHSPHSAVRPVANIGQANHLALLLCLSVASLWWLYQAGRLQAGLAVCLMLVLLWGLVITQSRIGWIIIPVFALLSFFWRGKAGFKRIPGRAIVGFVLLYAVMVIALPNISASLFDASVSSPVERVGEKSSSERMALFGEAWQISMAHPWFGAGWNSFGAQQLKLDANSGPSVFANHSHNLLLNFAAELGWPVTILVFGVLGYWFFASFLRGEINQVRGYAALFFMAVLIHSLVEFPLWYAYVLLPLALLMGVVHQERFGSKSVTMPRGYSVLFFFVMSLGLLFTAVDYRRVVRGFEYLGLASMGFKLEGASDEKPEFTLFPQFYDYFKFAKTEATENMPAEEIAFMEKMSSRFGEMPNLRHMALIYSLNNRPDDAIHTLLMIRQLHRCAYKDVYALWQRQADTNPKIFMKILLQLPKPNASTCKG